MLDDAIDVLLLRHYDAMTILFTVKLSLTHPRCVHMYSTVCAGMREAWRWVSDIHFSGKMIKTICECDEGVRFSAYVRHGE